MFPFFRSAIWKMLVSKGAFIETLLTRNK
jgi:hypothetical protein